MPERITKCEDCPLSAFWGKRVSSKTNAIFREVPYRGSKKAELLIVGESPGNEELMAGRPFVGRSGKLSDEVLRSVGIDPGTVFYANACRCMIDKSQLKETEVSLALQCCRPALVRAVELLKPKLIVCYGDIAMRQVLKLRGITNKRGIFRESKELNCWVLPTFHPAYCLRNIRNLEYFKPDLQQAARFLKGEIVPGTISGNVKTEIVESIRSILDRKKISVAVDTETQGLDWTDRNSVVIAYSVSAETGKGYTVLLLREARKDERPDTFITWERKEGRTAKTEKVGLKYIGDYERKVAELKELLSREDLCKVMMNGNYDLHRFRQLGIQDKDIKNYRMDIQVAYHLLDPDQHKAASLGHIQRVFFPESDDHKESFAVAVDKGDLVRVARDNPELLGDYAARDAETTLRCAKRIAEELKKYPALLNYHNKLAHPVTVEVLYEIEKNGILFDTKGVSAAKAEISSHIVSLQRQFLDLVPRKVIKKHEGKGCVLTRRDFLADVFFSKDGFRLKPLEITPSGQPSTNKKMFTVLLESLDPKSDAAKALSLYQEWSPVYKLYSTYLKGFEKAVRQDGRLHTQITKVMTATGRTSSRSPNLQNVPKRNKELAKVIRRLLVAAPGKCLVAADYSQQELRWIAHRSQDPEFLRVYRSGEDIHTKTAMALLGISDPSSIDPDVFNSARTKAKSCNFGFVYGMQAKKFQLYARDEYKLDLTLEEAENWRLRFFQLYRGLERWHQREIAFAQANGYCLSPFGFMRWLPNIRSDDFKLRSESERLAINTPIQNAGSDATLLAALWAKRRGIVDGVKARIVLFIHDELIFEVDEDHVPVFVAGLRDTMENLNEIFRRDFGFEMSVPLKAEIEVGYNLAEMKEFDEGDACDERKANCL